MLLHLDFCTEWLNPKFKMNQILGNEFESGFEVKEKKRKLENKRI